MPKLNVKTVPNKRSPCNYGDQNYPVCEEVIPLALWGSPPTPWRVRGGITSSHTESCHFLVYIILSFEWLKFENLRGSKRLLGTVFTFSFGTRSVDIEVLIINICGFVLAVTCDFRNHIAVAVVVSVVVCFETAFRGLVFTFSFDTRMVDFFYFLLV